MKACLRIFFSVLILMVFSVAAFAQDKTTSENNNFYDSSEYGIKFPIPTGFNLYTAKNPGSLASLFDERTVVFLVNTGVTDENVSVQCTPNITEEDIKSFKDISDNEPLDVPKYEKVSVRFINIGKNSDKLAVEHVFHMQGNVAGTLRQITFAHKGNGFTFTCGTAKERYQQANKNSFDMIFSEMEFQ